MLKTSPSNSVLTSCPELLKIASIALLPRKDLGEESLDPSLDGDLRDVVEQEAAHAPGLPFLVNDEGDLGGLGFGVQEVLGDRDDCLAARSGHDANNRQLVFVVDVRQFLHVFVGERYRMREVPRLN